MKNRKILFGLTALILSLQINQAQAVECENGDTFCIFNDRMQNMLSNFSNFRNNMMDNNGFANNLSFAGSFPHVDMINNEEEIIVNIDLPGMEKDNINLELFENYLLIQGKREYKKEEKSENYNISERSFGEFKRSIPFPSKVKIDDVKTKYTDGVLEVKLPKVEPIKPKSVKIDI